MTTMTMARPATADAPLRVKANPASSKVKAPSRALSTSLVRRVAPLSLAIALLGGVQVVTAGSAAVATLPPGMVSGLTVVEKAPPAPPPPTPAFSQANGLLFASVLNEAFPAKAAVAEPEATGSVVEQDPNELMAFGSRRAPRWLVETIQKAAAVAGVDPVYLVTLADVESSLSPVAKAPTSSAAGLYQFIDRTWLETLHAHAADHGFGAVAAQIKIVDDDPIIVDESKRSWILGLKRDPYLSAVMAAELIKDVQRELRMVGERELSEAELYLAHFFGAGSAVRFLQALDESPDAVAARLFPKAAKANRGLFSARSGKKSRNITVAELYDRIDDKIFRRMDRFGLIGQPAGRAGTLEATAAPAE
jgi:hypothetical protein